MSKINITARNDQLSPRMQNIPLRADLGSKLRAALQEQRPLPRALQTGSEQPLAARDE